MFLRTEKNSIKINLFYFLILKMFTIDLFLIPLSGI